MSVFSQRLRSSLTPAMIFAALTLGGIAASGCGGEAEAKFSFYSDSESKVSESKEVSQQIKIGTATQIDIGFPIGEVKLVNGASDVVTVKGEITVKGDDYLSPQTRQSRGQLLALLG